MFKIASSSVRHISLTGDIQAIEINQKEENEERIYVSLFTRNYDTYAFSERYKNVPFGELKKHTGLKVKKILKCPKDELKSYIGE